MVSKLSIFTTIAQFILGDAQAILPIFIHNPKSQQIEGVILTTAEADLQALLGQPPTTPPAS